MAGWLSITLRSIQNWNTIGLNSIVTLMKLVLNQTEGCNVNPNWRCNMNLTITKLKELSDKALDIVEDVFGERIEVSEFKINDSKTSAGFARYSDSSITISEYVMHFRTEDECVNTLVHEILHIKNPYDGHKNGWKVDSAIFNKSKYVETYGEITRLYNPSSEQLDKCKYQVICCDCGYLISRERMSKVVKYPSLYKCGVCGGKLNRIR